MFIARTLILGIFSIASISATDLSNEKSILTALLNLHQFRNLPQELHAFCIPDYEDIFDGWQRPFEFFSCYCHILKYKSFAAYQSNVTGPMNESLFQKMKTELLILAVQFLQRGITLTYKEHPYVAWCIYKQCHKDKDRFEAIASGILSDHKGVIALLEYPLIQVLGPTLFAKIESYEIDETNGVTVGKKQLRSSLVKDFRTVLMQKAPHFLFPTMQRAARKTTDFDTISKSLFVIQSGNVGQEHKWVRFNDHIMLKVSNHNQQKSYFVTHKNLVLFYGSRCGGLAVFRYKYPYIWIHTNVPHDKAILTAYTTEDNPLDINIAAEYSLLNTAHEEKDVLIHGLLRKCTHMLTTTSSLLEKLHSKATNMYTKQLIQWLYPTSIKDSPYFSQITEQNRLPIMLNKVFVHNRFTHEFVEETGFWGNHTRKDFPGEQSTHAPYPVEYRFTHKHHTELMLAVLNKQITLNTKPASDQ